jgi:hypothetical protein
LTHYLHDSVNGGIAELVRMSGKNVFGSFDDFFIFHFQFLFVVKKG